MVFMCASQLKSLDTDIPSSLITPDCIVKHCIGCLDSFADPCFFPLLMMSYPLEFRFKVLMDLRCVGCSVGIDIKELGGGWSAA